MKPHHRPVAAALGALLAIACPGAALAAERGCPGMAIEADAGFQAHFPDLLEHIRGEFTPRADIDACARVELRLEGDAVVTLTVKLPDGRAASRSVTRRDDVMPTLQALLLVPDHPTSISALAASPKPLPPRRPVHRESPSRPDRDEPPSSNEAAKRTLGVELSLITGARIGDGQLGVGAGALGLLEVHGWLLGFEGRADSYRPLLNGDRETALELALLAGRRFDLGGLAIDLSAGPAVAMKGLAFSQTERTAVIGMPPVPPPPPPRADPSTGPVPRLLLAARFGFSPRSVFRTFVGVDGEFGPARVADDAPSTSARLPIFTLGLALGATVGTP